jgi:hypothetical protein
MKTTKNFLSKIKTSNEGLTILVVFLDMLTGILGNKKKKSRNWRMILSILMPLMMRLMLILELFLRAILLEPGKKVLLLTTMMPKNLEDLWLEQTMAAYMMMKEMNFLSKKKKRVILCPKGVGTAPILFKCSQLSMFQKESLLMILSFMRTNREDQTKEG